MSTYTARTGRDSYVSESAPNANQSDSKIIRVRNSASGTTKQGFLYLAPHVPLGATVLSATLYLYGVGADGVSATVNVQRVAEWWRVSLQSLRARLTA